MTNENNLEELIKKYDIIGFEIKYDTFFEGNSSHQAYKIFPNILNGYKAFCKSNDEESIKDGMFFIYAFFVDDDGNLIDSFNKEREIKFLIGFPQIEGIDKFENLYTQVNNFIGTLIDESLRVSFIIESEEMKEVVKQLGG